MTPVALGPATLTTRLAVSRSLDSREPAPGPDHAIRELAENWVKALPSIDGQVMKPHLVQIVAARDGQAVCENIGPEIGVRP